jgi:hypothetical protein
VAFGAGCQSDYRTEVEADLACCEVAECYMPLATCPRLPVRIIRGGMNVKDLWGKLVDERRAGVELEGEKISCCTGCTSTRCGRMIALEISH